MSTLLSDIDAYNRVKKAMDERIGTPTTPPPSYIGPDGNTIYVDTYVVSQKAMVLRMVDDLTKDEYKRLIRMLYSVDMESQILAEVIVNQKIKEL